MLLREGRDPSVCFATSAFIGQLGGATLPVPLSLGAQVQWMWCSHKTKVGGETRHRRPENAVVLSIKCSIKALGRNSVTEWTWIATIKNLETFSRL